MYKRNKINKNKLDLTGHTYGRLYVNGPAKTGKWRSHWDCTCSCGTHVPEVLTANLRKKGGHTESCGCLRKERIAQANKIHKTKHGYYKHPAYSVWVDMNTRCYNKKYRDYHRYGGRGITINRRWLSNPGLFCEWAIENGYKEGLIIDRVNNDKGYHSSNCRFVTPSASASNRAITDRNTSGFIGVSYFKGKYQCCVVHNKKRKFLGLFSDPIEAARIRDSYILQNKLPHRLNMTY